MVIILYTDNVFIVIIFSELLIPTSLANYLLIFIPFNFASVLVVLVVRVVAHPIYTFEAGAYRYNRSLNYSIISFASRRYSSYFVGWVYY
jgi:hypothetical protein